MILEIFLNLKDSEILRIIWLLLLSFTVRASEEELLLSRMGGFWHDTPGTALEELTCL